MCDSETLFVIQSNVEIFHGTSCTYWTPGRELNSLYYVFLLIVTCVSVALMQCLFRGIYRPGMTLVLLHLGFYLTSVLYCFYVMEESFSVCGF